ASFNGWGREDSDIMVRLIRAGVRRKDGRYATAVLHLWHPDFDRSRLPEHERRLAEVVQRDRVRALRGLSPLAGRPMREIRPAERSDSALIFEFVCKLADYEKLLHAVVATEVDVVRDLFGANPRVFCDLAYWGGAPAGFALWFHNYSTFRGRHGIYLE